MDDVRVQIRLERLEVGPLPSPEEFVFRVSEDLPDRAVVDAVPIRASVGRASEKLRLFL